MGDKLRALEMSEHIYNNFIDFGTIWMELTRTDPVVTRITVVLFFVQK